MIKITNMSETKERPLKRYSFSDAPTGVPLLIINGNNCAKAGEVVVIFSSIGNYERGILCSYGGGSGQLHVPCDGQVFLFEEVNNPQDFVITFEKE